MENENFGRHASHRLYESAVGEGVPEQPEHLAPGTIMDLAAGVPVLPAVDAHHSGCDTCRDLVIRARAELSRLQAPAQRARVAAIRQSVLAVLATRRPHLRRVVSFKSAGSSDAAGPFSYPMAAAPTNHEHSRKGPYLVDVVSDEGSVKVTVTPHPEHSLELTAEAPGTWLRDGVVRATFLNDDGEPVALRDEAGNPLTIEIQMDLLKPDATLGVWLKRVAVPIEASQIEITAFARKETPET
jgi:hypothetical protein